MVIEGLKVAWLSREAKGGCKILKWGNTYQPSKGTYVVVRLIALLFQRLHTSVMQLHMAIIGAWLSQVKFVPV